MHVQFLGWYGSIKELTKEKYMAYLVCDDVVLWSLDVSRESVDPIDDIYRHTNNKQLDSRLLYYVVISYSVFCICGTLSWPSTIIFLLL